MTCLFSKNLFWPHWPSSRRSKIEKIVFFCLQFGKRSFFDTIFIIKSRIVGFWGSNLGIIFVIYRVMIYINVVEVGTILMGFLGPTNAFFWTIRVSNFIRGWIFNMLYHVSMWFHILTELIQVILGYTKTFPLLGTCGKRLFDFLDIFKEVTQAQKPY